ncbi:unnamed protein product [Gadus morhua 'NCC']
MYPSLPLALSPSLSVSLALSDSFLHRIVKCPYDSSSGVSKHLRHNSFSPFSASISDTTFSTSSSSSSPSTSSYCKLVHLLLHLTPSTSSSSITYSLLHVCESRTNEEMFKC